MAHQLHETPPRYYPPDVAVMRLPPRDIRNTKNGIVDSEIIFTRGGIEEPHVLRVPGSFAGYVAGKTAELIANPHKIDILAERA